LVIPVINIPLGIGIYMVVKSQIASINAAAASKQAELTARAEQLEREKAEAEARAKVAEEEARAEEESEAPVIRPPANPGGSNNKTEEPKETPATPGGELVLTATCNGGGCDNLAPLTKSTDRVTVVVTADAELEVPNYWERLDENTIRRRFSPPAQADAGTVKPLEVEIKSLDGRAKKLTFSIDLWFDIAYDNNN
jgi:hypothetical protein